jgi:acetyl esterase
MGLAPQARRLLDRFDEVGVKSYAAMTVLEARATVEASVALQAEPPAAVGSTDLLVAGAAGLLPARLYEPGGVDGGPLVVYFHGGGFVTGGIEVADAFCRGLAAAAASRVVSVGYRLSPETCFPGPFEDCFAATASLATAAGELGTAPGRVVLCGDSAGGNLAAAVALAARDRGGPAIERLLLMYATLAPPDHGDFPSYTENGSGYGLDLAGLEWFWRHYLGEPGDGTNPYAAPLLADDLSDLPPTFVLGAEFDLLRDEGTAFAERLAATGVPTAVEVVPGMIHGFLWMDRYFEAEAATARALLADAIATPVTVEAER